MFLLLLCLRRLRRRRLRRRRHSNNVFVLCGVVVVVVVVFGGTLLFCSFFPPPPPLFFLSQPKNTPASSKISLPFLSSSFPSSSFSFKKFRNAFHFHCVSYYLLMHFADTKTRAHKRALKITHNAVVVVVVVVMMMFESENRLGARASRIVDGIEGMTTRTAEDDANGFCQNLKVSREKFKIQKEDENDENKKRRVDTRTTTRTTTDENEEDATAERRAKKMKREEGNVATNGVKKGLKERMEDTNGGTSCTPTENVSVVGAATAAVTAKTEQEQEQEQEQEEGQTRDPMTIDCVDDGGNINTDTDDGAVTPASAEEIEKDELNESIQNDVITPNMKKVPKNNNNTDGNLTSIGNKKPRQTKSLSLLCERFIGLYSSGYENLISLDEVCSTLGVERRRIYDIVNVLEAVEIVVRKGKNKYAWFGVSRLPSAIEKIEKFGAKSFDIKLPERLSLQVSEPSLPIQTNDTDVVNGVKTKANNDADDADPTNEASTSKAAVGKKETSERREKSLSLMTQKFITLFMEAKDGVLSLEDAAAAMLMSEGDTDAKTAGDFNEIEVKKKIRRLYDIANILSSLRLLSKIHLMDSRKPAFRWMRAENTVRKLIAAGKEHEWFGTSPKCPGAKQNLESPIKEGVNDDAEKLSIGALVADTVPRLLPSDITESRRNDREIFAALRTMESLIQAQTHDLSAKSVDQSTRRGPKKIPAMFLTTANLFGTGKSFQSRTGDGIFNQYINNFTQNMQR